MPASLRHLTFLIVGMALCLSSAMAQGWAVKEYLKDLAETEEMATGLHELSTVERANLEKLIAYEVASARAGNVNGFAGTFSGRRSSDELKATGLDRLSATQRERLDQHIAGFIATTPVISYVRRSDRGGDQHTAMDTERRGPLLEVHGQVDLTVGGSSHGTYYGGALTTTISDPKGRFNATVSIATSRGAVPYHTPYYGRYPYRGPVRLP